MAILDDCSACLRSFCTVRLDVTYVLENLTGDFFGEHFLFFSLDLLFKSNLVLVMFHSVIMLDKQSLVSFVSALNFLLVALDCFVDSVLLHRIVVLDHRRVLEWRDVRTVEQRLQFAGRHRVLQKSVAVRRLTGQVVLRVRRRAKVATGHTVSGKEVAEVVSHLVAGYLSVLLNQLTRRKWEVGVPFLRTLAVFNLAPGLVVQPLLIVKK